MLRFTVLVPLVLLCSNFNHLLASNLLDYQIMDVQSQIVNQFKVTKSRVQVGQEPVNQFVMHRWEKKNAKSQNVRGVLLLQSGLGGKFSLYELAPLKDSTAAFFARRNIVVYGYSPRAAQIPVGACESGSIDCGPAANWTLNTFVDDLLFIRSQIAQDWPGKKVVLGGLSLGAINTIAAINQYPGDFDGAIIWEGMLASADPEVLNLNAGYCAFLENELAEGRFIDGQSLTFFKQAVALAVNDPNGPSPIAPGLGLPPITNHQFFVFLLTEEAPGPATLPVPNYVLTIGNFLEGRFAFIDEGRIIEDLLNFNNYVPNAAVRDISCSLAAIETSYTNNLSQFNGAVLAIGGGRGFGAYLPDQLALFTNASSLDFEFTEEFGHVDHIFLPTPIHRQYVEIPILRWLNQKVFR